MRNNDVAPRILFIVVVLMLSILTIKVTAQDYIAPDFTLIDIDENEFSLSDYRGKIVLLDFFATWCTPCKMEMYELKYLHKFFGESLEIISISVDPDYDTVEHLRRFREENPGKDLTWTVARDIAGLSQEYDVRAIPTLVIIDQNGYIRYRHVGSTQRDTLIEEIEELSAALNKPPKASFTYSPTSPIQGETVTFNASASYDPDGTIVSYEWDFGDSAIGTGVITTHIYATSNTYTITLTVTDNDNTSDTVVAEVTVSPLAVAVHDVAIVNVSMTREVVTVGESVSITAMAKNKGAETETFDVTIYYDTTMIGTQTITNLASGASKTLTLSWNTAKVSPGIYTIKAVASTVTGETNTADNTRTGGTVTIQKLSSTIFIFTSPTTVTVSASIVINGSISPIRSGMTVEIQYRPVGGAWSTLATVKTDADGRYSYTWSPAAGTYEIRAKTTADESDVETVTVQGAPAPSILPYLAGIAIVIVVAMVVYVVRARKPKQT